MNDRTINMLPAEIEKKSFEIIGQELGDIVLDPLNELIIKRVIHTTADFDYARNLVFSDNAVAVAKEAIKKGATIVTDTQMAMAGINKKKLAEFGCEVFCFMADEDVAQTAVSKGTTRAVASMEKAAALGRPLIFVIGNAPTALIRLHEMIGKKEINPLLIVGVPVGFVNVVESKELIMNTDVTYIVAKGRKGGSNVAAAIVNAIIYQM